MEITIFVISGIIIALTEVAKRVFDMDLVTQERFLPVINIVFGLILGVLFLKTGELKMDLLFGLLAGLGAGGLYDISPIKNVVKTIGK